MDNLDLNSITKIYNYVPFEHKKFCNRQSYESYLKYILPSKEDDWFQIEVYNKDFRHCVHNMFNYIINNNLEEWFINFKPDSDKGYLWSSNPIIDKISDGVNNDGHSGATFSYCLRIMQDIFCNNNLKKWLKPINDRLK